MLWKGDLDFDLIEVKTPGLFKIRDYYNIIKKYPNPNEIHVDELNTPGYLGFVITSPLTESVAQEAKIILNFIKESEVIHRQEFETRIVRPKIELYVPEKVEVLPAEETKVDIKLKYTGYGNCYGKIIVSEDREKLVFDVKDLRDLFLVMANFQTFKQFLRKCKISEKDFTGSEIPEEQYDYRGFLIHSTQLTNFTPANFFESIKTIVENKELMGILERTIEESADVATNLFKAVIDLVEKRPVEGVFLVDPQIEPIELNVGERRLYVCIAYVDEFGNYYAEMKTIPIVLHEKQRIMFGQDWEEQAGDWNWLRNK